MFTHPVKLITATEAAIDPAPQGAYVVSLTLSSSDRTFDSRIVRGFYWSAEREHRTRGVDLGLLNRLSEATGGTLLAGEAMPFSGRAPAYVSLRAWLLVAAFFAFLGELLAPAAGGMLGRRSGEPSTGGRKAAA